jgi:hypothetical protein
MAPPPMMPQHPAAYAFDEDEQYRLARGAQPYAHGQYQLPVAAPTPHHPVQFQPGMTPDAVVPGRPLWHPQPSFDNGVGAFGRYHPNLDVAPMAIPDGLQQGWRPNAVAPVFPQLYPQAIRDDTRAYGQYHNAHIAPLPVGQVFYPHQLAPHDAVLPPSPPGSERDENLCFPYLNMGAWGEVLTPDGYVQSVEAKKQDKLRRLKERRQKKEEKEKRAKEETERR